MTQRELATAAGLALSTIKKIEQGTYGGIRLETVRKLAVVLQVPSTALLSEPDAPVPSPQSAQRWEPVRLALEGADRDEPQDEPTLERLRRDFGTVLPLLLASQFDAMGAILPGLLRDADALVALSADGAQTDARTLRSNIRQVTGSLMLHNWQFTTAERAFVLAMEDASDPLTAMSVADERCWGLIRQGKLAETMDVALRLAEQHEPRMTASRDELAAYGKLMIRASMAAARDNRPDDAAEMLRLARMAAVGAGSDFVLPYSPWHVFGPVSVSIFAAELAMIQEHPEVVLAIGRRLSGARPAMPVPRIAPSFRLDVAHAHTLLRHDEQAVAVLRQLRDDRPQWFPRQRYAADILAKLISHRRTLTADMRELADAVRLPL
ncbi:MAG: helix-turn-helix domain-containing protein [Streptosporangiaceae bacterium]